MSNTILIWVIPNASRTELIETLSASNCAGFEYYPAETQVLKIRLKAQALEGAANDELLRFLAKYLQVPKSTLEIIKGHQSRYKVLSF